MSSKEDVTVRILHTTDSHVGEQEMIPLIFFDWIHHIILYILCSSTLLAPAFPCEQLVWANIFGQLQFEVSDEESSQFKASPENDIPFFG